jgi:SAM-dependent methyltransferase
MHRSLEQSYDEYPRIEEAFKEALDESLNPSGPDILYEMIGRLGLPAGADVLDLGCGEGKQAVELAKHFGFRVVGVDPIAQNVDLARKLAGRASVTARFERGSTDAIPLPEASVDLIWCREVLCLVADLQTAFAECRRVLKPGGLMLLYQMFATERMEPRELEALCESQYAAPSSWNVQHVEDLATAAGFEIEACTEFAGQWGEFAQEQRGEPGRHLVHAARLLRDPERYIAQFGRANYEIKLGDCLWHIYRMIGKLSGRAYLLRSPAPKMRSSS